MYRLKPSKAFEKAATKLFRSGRLDAVTFKKVDLMLHENPFDPRLKTHKVVSKHYGKRYSSRIDGDLRIIWDFDENDNLVLLLLDIGGHEGAKGVYK